MLYQKQLTIQLRHKQLIGVFPDPAGIFGFNIIYTGPNPMSLAITYGNEPDTTWHDFTDYVDGLQDIALTWSTTQTATGEVPTGQFVAKKGVSSTLTFEREAKEFIRQHLIDAVAATNNEIEVRITDTASGIYSGYVMKASDLSWCEFNALCVYNVNLRQADLAIQCIERTMIADNWNGWFQNEPVDVNNTPTGGVPPPKYHPRFSYCIERRPNGVLVLEWVVTSIIAVLYTLIYTIFYPILLIIYGLIAVINGIITAINTIPGISISLIPNPLPASPGSVLSGWSNLMIEAAGCGREHAAPLVRDYISNVCDKCGILYDASTIDVFFAPFLTITHSDGVQYTEPNPHYNACYFFPSVERGVRRFRNWSLLSGFSSRDTTTYYQPANQPILALSDLLDQLKKLYNSRWEIRNALNPATSQLVPYLYFQRKDTWVNKAPLYDFSNVGVDRSKIVEGICFQQSEYTVPASMNGLYEDDPSDKCGHEANYQQNGDPLSFNHTAIDPHFYGILDKNSGFAAAKFNNDGASTSYLYDALQTCWSIIGFLSGFSLSDLGDMMRDYADFSLLLQLETVTKPKILIWDGKNDPVTGLQYINAKVVKDVIVIAGVSYIVGHAAYPAITGWPPMPDVNPLYPYQVKPTKSVLTTLAAPSTVPAVTPDNQWWKVHPPQTKVIGGGGSGTPGYYEVIDPISVVRSSNPAILVNWPMYFNPYFKGTMWDKFHWIDDPRKNPQLHKTWSLKIPLCKEDIEKLGLTDDGTGVKLLSSVLLNTRYLNVGIITEITIDYGTGGPNGVGATITLKGYV